MDWTALSVLAALMVGAIGYLARDMHRVHDRLEARMNARFDQVERRFEHVDARFDRLEQRVDGLTERYVRHLEAHAAH